VLPHDTYGRDFGLFISEKLPFILGTNVAGIVQKLGANVTKYSVGDRIFGQAFIAHPTPDQAGLQEYAILEVASTAKVPSGFTDADVVTLPVNVVTAFAALFHPLGLNMPPPFPSTKPPFDYSAETLVIIGGGSNVGKIGLQLAALAGIGKIVVTASATHEEQLLKLGATHVFDRHSPTLSEEILGVTGPDVTHVFDCANWTFELATSIVTTTSASCIVALHPVEGEAKTHIETQRPKCDAKFLEGSAHSLSYELPEFWSALPVWLQEGKIAIPPYRVIEGLDVEKVNEALDSYRDGSRVVQAVVRPNGEI
jgi:NADPH2:quinone reductase